MAEEENNNEEHKIIKAFTDKDWNEIKSTDSWAIFKIMSEFVEGFEKLAKIGPCVTLFGSARTTEDHEYYVMAEEIAANPRARSATLRVGTRTDAPARPADRAALGLPPIATRGDAH